MLFSKYKSYFYINKKLSRRKEFIRYCHYFTNYIIELFRIIFVVYLMMALNKNKEIKTNFFL